MSTEDPLVILLAHCFYETPLVGQYLKEYDPGRPGVDPLGRAMTAHIVGTYELSEAMTFDDYTDAHTTWTLVDPHNPIRPDGKPNRPLTAFSVEIRNRSSFARESN